MHDKPTDTEQLVAVQLLQIALEDDDAGLIEARLVGDDLAYIVDAYGDILQLLVHKRSELSGDEPAEREDSDEL